MIEVTVLTYLLDKTSALKDVYAERPTRIPELYIMIEKTGSQTDDMITTSTIAIQSVTDSMQGGTLLDAMSLNEEVKTAMESLEEEPDIVMVRLNSDYNYTDPTTKEYRYQAVYQITHY